MSYYLPQEMDPSASQPAKHMAKLLQLTEFNHLKEGEARIEFLMRGHELVRAGRKVLGSVHLPSVQGQLKDVFIWMLEEKFGELPDFLIILDAQYWLDASEFHREVLVYHELAHTTHAVDKYGTPRYDDEGRPVFAIRGHDVEEFASVIRRYGLHSEELIEFFKANDDHKAATS